MHGGSMTPRNNWSNSEPTSVHRGYEDRYANVVLLLSEAT